MKEELRRKRREVLEFVEDSHNMKQAREQCKEILKNSRKRRNEKIFGIYRQEKLRYIFTFPLYIYFNFNK